MSATEFAARRVVHGLRWLLFSPLRLPLTLSAKLAMAPSINRLDAPLRGYLDRRHRQGVSGS